MKDIQFDYTINDVDGVMVYSVPDDTVISEDDAEADAEIASIQAGTYPPRFVIMED